MNIYIRFGFKKNY